MSVAFDQSGSLLRGVRPEDADAVYVAGVRASQRGQEAEALPLLEQAVVLHPGDPRMWQVLGLLNRRGEDLAPAMAAFGKAAALAPGDALIAHSLARSTLEAGLPSVGLFDRALALAPDDESIRLGRTAAMFAEGEVDAAIADLEARLAARPLWISGHATLARLRWLRGERAGFAASLEGAVAAAPRDAMVWRDYGETLMHAELYGEVLALVARGRAAAGAHMAFDVLETLAVSELGETERADRLWAALGPIGHVTLAARYMRHLLKAGRPEEASRFGQTWLAGEMPDLIWPYMAAAWRLTGDPRWQALEGEEKLVGIHDLDLPDLPALATRLRGLHLALGQPLEQSVRGGTQTDGPLFSRIEPEIRALRAAIVAAVERHIAQLPAPRPGHPTLIERRGPPVRFAGSWSVRLANAGFHSNHVHPAGWLSSAFYVALPETMGERQAGWLKLGEPQAELGLALAPFRTVEPRPGRLVLFPSTMWHGTIPFDEGERLTVAFDVARPL
jgi:tetratricopeptide (TPR) repeat protein